jgi:circadian clock protein KaiC
MAKAKKPPADATLEALQKCPTGIKGLDEITGGGLPVGRPTLVCGTAGCGKTILGMEFVVRGAMQFDEPGVFMSFEESGKELIKNMASLGFDLQDLMDRGKLLIDYVYIERSEIQETGEYDLEGLFIRLGCAIDNIGAKRVVLDTVEALFGGLPNEGILRAELRRLFRWLKDRGITAVITGERGENTLTRHGLEEYVADCVILLDHRVQEQIATRRLRIVKYRGSAHGIDEYPFLIDDQGIAILPITALGLDHPASTERVSTGIPRLDNMLGGQGVYRGSSVLVSGTSGTGKTSIAAFFAEAACRRGERALYFAFEEAPQQIMRNMRSIGLDLEPWVERGLLRFHAARPTLYGLEKHLTTIHKLVKDFHPQVVAMDPISNLTSVGTAMEVKATLNRFIDYLKMQQITGVFTNFTKDGESLEHTDVGVSSLMDTWILLNCLESEGERNRVLYILKSRGMAHSNQVREFLLTDQGVELVDVYLGPGGALTGAARVSQEAREKAETLVRRQEIELRQRQIERKRAVLAAKIEALKAEFAAEEEELQKRLNQDKLAEQVLVEARAEMARLRGEDKPAPEKGK